MRVKDYNREIDLWQLYWAITRMKTFIMAFMDEKKTSKLIRIICNNLFLMNQTKKPNHKYLEMQQSVAQLIYYKIYQIFSIEKNIYNTILFCNSSVLTMI